MISLVISLCACRSYESFYTNLYHNSYLCLTHLLLFILSFWLSEKFKKNPPLKVKDSAKDGGSGHIAAQTFAFRELAAATRNFRGDCQLGEGGFGRVYKGRLESSDQVGQVCLTEINYETKKPMLIQIM